MNQQIPVGTIFVYAGETYSFMRMETHGRVKAEHTTSGFRVSLPPEAANSIFVK